MYVSKFLPWRPEFIIVLNNVLIGAVECHGERGSGAAGGGFEPGVGGDHVIRQNGAVTPAAHAQPRWVRHARADDIIDAGFEIFHFIVAPVGENRARILLARARRCRDSSRPEPHIHAP